MNFILNNFVTIILILIILILIIVIVLKNIKKLKKYLKNESKCFNCKKTCKFNENKN